MCCIANDDGLTVIDVTDPYNPAYCFLQSRTPMTAEQYVRDYYSVPNSDVPKDDDAWKTEEYVQKCIHRLDGERLVTLQMLAEAWPQEYMKSFENQKRQEMLRGDNEPQNTTDESAGDPVVATVLPALTEMSLKSATIHSLEIDDIEELDGILDIPGMAGSMKDILQQRTELTPIGVTLLKKIFAIESQTQPRSLDLSEFSHCLSPDQVLDVVSEYGDSLDVLNLSYHTNLTGDIVLKVLQAAPRLRRLVLMGCTSVVDDELYRIRHVEPHLFLHMEALLHPAFLPVLEDGSIRVRYPCAFSVIGSHKYHRSIFGASLPFFTPTQALQTLYRYMSIASSLLYDSEVHMRPFTFAEAVFSASSQPLGEPWRERSIVAIPTPSFSNLRGEAPGWLFVYDGRQEYNPKYKTKWAFVWCEPRSRDEADKTQSSDDETAEDDEEVMLPFTYKIYDVRGFVRAAIEQGRPAPPEDLVHSLEELLKELKEGQEQTQEQKKHKYLEPLALMNDEDFEDYLFRF